MTTEVLKINPEEIEKFKTILTSQESIMSIPVTNPYEAFRVRYDDGLIVGYTSGKIVVTMESGKRIVGKVLMLLEKGTGQYDIVIGSDEAGKGEWLGPMTIAAVALTPEQSVYLRSQGVMDSKELSMNKIMELPEIIMNNCLSQYVVTITPQRFNQLLHEMKDEGKTLNDMLAWGHAKAIDQVYSDVTSEAKPLTIKVLIDEFDKLKTERRLQKVLNMKEVIVEQMPKAEEDIAVASAGILARASREIWIDKESRRLGIELRKISPLEILSMKEVSYVAKESFLKRR